jgi:hypothetical protein
LLCVVKWSTFRVVWEGVFIVYAFVVPNKGDVVVLAGKLVAAGHFDVRVEGGGVRFEPFAAPFGFEWIGALEEHFDCSVREVG